MSTDLPASHQPRGRTPASLRLIGAVLALVLMAACPWRPAAPRLPEPGARAMVVSAHPLASQAGIGILQQGGNAVDAAVATAFALSVVEPYSSGLGGGGFMLIYPGPGPEVKVEVLDYRETAPAAASADMYLKDGKPAPGLSTRGALAVAVPGTVAGLAAALERYGTMTLAQVIAPALALARDGFAVDSAMVQRSLLMAGQLNKDEDAARAFLHDGVPYREGEILKQPDLARTLELIAQHGPEVFYQGEIGKAIAADVQAKGGIVTAADLAGYQVRWRKPVTGRYRGFDVVSMPPPSSGGAVIVEMLNILGGYDLRTMGWDSHATVHVMAEAMRLAFADRAAFMGDPAFVDAPLAQLLDPGYAARLRESIDPARARSSREVVAGAGIIPPPDGLPYPADESFHTTHLSVVDEKGAAVSLTQTVNTTFGSGVVARGTGVLLNNEMDDFAAQPGAPNAFGLIQGRANAIAPHKIPLSSMSPTMVFRDGKLRMVVGSPGGPRIITTVLQVMLNVLDHDMNIAGAVTAPRIHHQWLPDRLYIESGRLSPGAMAALIARGHRISNYLIPCNAQAILVLPDGTVEGASDPRGIGQPESLP